MSLGILFHAVVLAIVASSTQAAAPDSVGLSVRAAPRGAWTFEVTAEAKRVEIAGDVTNWDAIAMKREGTGRFVLSLRAAPGVHQVAVRLDGGPWRVPAGLTRVTDEFGGVAGILVLAPPPRPPGDARGKPGSPPGASDR